MLLDRAQKGATVSERASAERFKMIVGVHLFLIRDGRVLLTRRCNTGFADGLYSVIAGHLDGDEELREATAREAHEEASIRIDLDDLQLVGVIHRKAADERLNFFLLAMRWGGEITNAEPEKCDDMAWFALDGLPQNTVPYVQRALENFQRGILFDSHGWDRKMIPGCHEISEVG